MWINRTFNSGYVKCHPELQQRPNSRSEAVYCLLTLEFKSKPKAETVKVLTTGALAKFTMANLEWGEYCWVIGKIAEIPWISRTGLVIEAEQVCPLKSIIRHREKVTLSYAEFSRIIKRLMALDPDFRKFKLDAHQTWMQRLYDKVENERLVTDGTV